MNIFDEHAKSLNANREKIMAEVEFNRISNEEEKAAPGELAIAPIFGMDAPARKLSEYLAAATGWVYGCVSVIAEKIGSVQFQLNEIKNGEVVPVESHPVLDLLYRCNPIQTKFDFWELAAKYLELTGESPIYLERANEKAEPMSMSLLIPTKFSLAGAPSKDNPFLPYDHYEYTPGATKPLRLETWEVLFLKNTDPNKPYRGSGTIAAAAKTIDVDNFSEDYNRMFFYNSARPDTILTTDKTLTKKQREDLKKAIKQTYGGVKNAHKTLVLEHGFKYDRIGLSQKDMDFLEQQKFSRDKIFSIFRVPKSLVAVSDDVNYANAKTHTAVFIENTIKPKLNRIVEQLNEFLIPLYKDAARRGLFLTYEDPTPADTDMNLKYYDNGLKNGWLTPNEVRADEGYDSLGADGDIRLPFIPGAPNPMLGMGDGQPAKTFVKKDRREFARHRLYLATKEKTISDRAEKEANKLVDLVTEKIVAEVKKNRDKKAVEIEPAAPVVDRAKMAEEFWNVMVKNADGLEKTFKDKMIDIFRSQKDVIIGRLSDTRSFENGKVKAGIPVDDFLLDLPDDTTVTVRAVLPTMNEIVLIQGAEAMKLVGKDKSDFNIHAKRIQKWIEKRTFDFADEVNVTTNNKLRDTLSEGIAAGEGIDDLRRRVENTFDEMEKSRAETIARSETLLASNKATEEAYAQSGVVSGVEWLTAFDERTCEFCGLMNGKTVDVGDNFFNKNDSLIGSDGGNIDFGYRSIDVPPLHPNCRCTIIPIIE